MLSFSSKIKPWRDENVKLCRKYPKVLPELLKQRVCTRNSSWGDFPHISEWCPNFIMLMNAGNTILATGLVGKICVFLGCVVYKFTKY